ncbi:MAG: YheT family hydrolase [Syntrophales bacterium]
MNENFETWSFRPTFWARNPHLQTVFASLKLRAAGMNRMIACTRKMIIDAGDGVRLIGFFSQHPESESRGLIMMIHGWEGSSQSTYMLCTGRYLFGKGYDIFRLNMRDHGDSHHLNEGLFHGALIEEIFKAAAEVSSLSADKPFAIIGFSLGGNFALRIARKCASSEIPGLKRVIAVSPVLDPHKTTIAIDRGSSIYRNYFLKKWKASLRKKQSLFPGKYDFGHMLQAETCMELTDRIIPVYSPFADSREYFREYTLLGNVFSDLEVPVLIMTARDDPFIDPVDFYDLHGNEHLRISIQRYGGHCGFLDPFPFGCWSDRRIYDILNN